MEKNISVDELYEIIKFTLENFIEENKKYKKQLKKSLIKVYKYVNSIIENKEDEIIEKDLKKSKSKNKNDINDINEEEKETNEELLKLKLKAKNLQFVIWEQRYIYYITDLKNEIKELKKKLNQEKLKHIEQDHNNKNNLFPGLIRQKEKIKSKNIKLIPMFPSKKKIILKEDNNEKDEKIDLTTKTDLILKNVSVFDRNKLLGNYRLNTSGNFVYQTKLKEFKDIMMSYPDFVKKHPRVKMNNGNNNTVI